nr:hypothetical protein [Tanacetum cinerariifolium]
MADKYCSRNEMQKIKTELWNLEVQGTLAMDLGEIRALQARDQACAENGTKESGPKENYKVKPRCNIKPKPSTINHYHHYHQFPASGYD